MPARDLTLSLRIIADAAQAVRALRGTASEAREVGIALDRTARRIDTFETLRQTASDLGTQLQQSRDRARGLTVELISLVNAEDQLAGVRALRQLQADARAATTALDASRRSARELTGELVAASLARDRLGEVQRLRALQAEIDRVGGEAAAAGTRARALTGDLIAASSAKDRLGEVTRLRTLLGDLQRLTGELTQARTAARETSQALIGATVAQGQSRTLQTLVMLREELTTVRREGAAARAELAALDQIETRSATQNQRRAQVAVIARTADRRTATIEERIPALEGRLRSVGIDPAAAATEAQRLAQVTGRIRELSAAQTTAVQTAQRLESRIQTLGAEAAALSTRLAGAGVNTRALGAEETRLQALASRVQLLAREQQAAVASAQRLTAELTPLRREAATLSTALAGVGLNTANLSAEEARLRQLAGQFTALSRAQAQAVATSQALERQLAPLAREAAALSTRLANGEVNTANLPGEEARLREQTGRIRELNAAREAANATAREAERDLARVSEQLGRVSAELRTAEVGTDNLTQAKAALAQSARDTAAATQAEAQALARQRQLDDARQRLGLADPAAIRAQADGIRDAYRTIRSAQETTRAETVRGFFAMTQAARNHAAELRRGVPGASLLGGAGTAGRNFIASAAAGAGLIGGGYGLVQAIASVRDVTVQFESYRIALEAVTGSQDRAADSIAFTRSISNELGLEVGRLTERYTQFAAATRGTRLEGEAGQKVFEQLASGFAVLGLSAERQALAYQAVTQILGKGVVQAEELRGQLAESFPGAVEQAARALDVSTARLNELIRTGQVSGVDFVIAFGAQIEKELGDRVPTAVESSRAAFGRFANAITELQQQVGNGGIVPALTDAVVVLTERLKDPAVTNNLTAIGVGVVNAFRYLVDNADTIIEILAGLAGAKLGSSIGATVGGAVGALSPVPGGTLIGAQIGAVGGALIGGGLAAGAVDNALDDTGTAVTRSRDAVRDYRAELRALGERYQQTAQDFERAGIALDSDVAERALGALRREIETVNSDQLRTARTELEKLATAYRATAQALREQNIALESPQAQAYLAPLQSEIDRIRGRPTVDPATDADQQAARDRINAATQAAEAIGRAGNNLTRLRANLEATAAVAAATIAAQTQIIEEAERANLITAEEGIRRRTDLTRRAITQEIAIRRAEIGGIDNQIAQVQAVRSDRDVADREKQVTDLAAQRVRIQGQINALKVRETETIRAAAAAAQVQRDADALRVSELRGQLAALNRDAAGVARAAFTQATVEFDADLSSPDPARREVAAELVNRRVAEAEFGTLGDDAQTRLAALQQQADALAQGVQAGQIGSGQAQTQLADALREARPELDALLARLQALAQTVGPQAEAQVAGITSALQTLALSAQSPLAQLLGEWRNTTNQLQQLSANFTDDFADRLTALFTGGTFQIRDFFATLLTELTRVSLQSAIGNLFGGGGIGGLLSGLLGAGGAAAGVPTNFTSGGFGPGTGLQGLASGGPVQRFDDTGPIRGPGTETSDSILADVPVGAFILNAQAARRLVRLSNGEQFVAPRDVRRIGLDVLTAINRGPSGIARFATGGPVQALASRVASDSGRGGSDFHAARSGSAAGGRAAAATVVNVDARQAQDPAAVQRAVDAGVRAAFASLNRSAARGLPAGA